MNLWFFNQIPVKFVDEQAAMDQAVPWAGKKGRRKQKASRKGRRP